MNTCEKIARVDPEGHDVNCQKLPGISHDAADMVRALKKEMDLSNSKEQNLKKLVDCMNQFLTEGSEKKKDDLLREIDKISTNYSGNVDVIEKMGYFSLERYKAEGNPIFVIFTAYQVHELSQMGVPTGGEFANLQDDFYGIMLTQLQKASDNTSPLLQRVFEILGDPFQEWLHTQLSDNQKIGEEEKTTILRRYVNYRSE